MARDVPFSAIYWGSLEPIRRVLLPQNAPASQSEVRSGTARRYRGSAFGVLSQVARALTVILTKYVRRGHVPLHE